MNRLFCRLTLLVAWTCATTIGIGAAPADAGPGVQNSKVGDDQLSSELAALLAHQSAWTASLHVEASSGYDDNLLLSQSNPERSGFARAGVQSLLWHVPQNRSDYFVFLNAESTRYFTGKSVHGQSQAFTGVEWRYRRENAFSFSVDAQGYYIDQIFDISDTSIQRVVAELKVAGVKVGPTFHWDFSPWMWIEVSAKASRENLDEIVVASGADTRDRTRVTEPLLRLGWHPTDRFELSVGATERNRRYGSHARYTITGKIDTGVLAIHEFENDARAVVEWGGDRHWKTTTRFGRLRYLDNGSGYLNYTQPFVGQEIEWSVGKWLVHAEATARRKKYDHQTENHPGELPGTAILPALIKEEYDADLRVERGLGGAWTVYAEYQWERTRSTDVIASYRVNEGLLGMRWSWEK